MLTVSVASAAMTKFWALRLPAEVATEITGFKVYSSPTTNGPYTFVKDCGIPELVGDGTYRRCNTDIEVVGEIYFVVTAAGNWQTSESDYSAEIIGKPPLQAPTMQGDKDNPIIEIIVIDPSFPPAPEEGPVENP